MWVRLWSLCLRSPGRRAPLGAGPAVRAPPALLLPGGLGCWWCHCRGCWVHRCCCHWRGPRVPGAWMQPLLLVELVPGLPPLGAGPPVLLWFLMLWGWIPHWGQGLFFPFLPQLLAVVPAGLLCVCTGQAAATWWGAFAQARRPWLRAQSHSLPRARPRPGPLPEVGGAPLVPLLPGVQPARLRGCSCLALRLHPLRVDPLPVSGRCLVVTERRDKGRTRHEADVTLDS